MLEVSLALNPIPAMQHTAVHVEALQPTVVHCRPSVILHEIGNILEHVMLLPRLLFYLPSIISQALTQPSDSFNTSVHQTSSGMPHIGSAISSLSPSLLITQHRHKQYHDLAGMLSCWDRGHTNRYWCVLTFFSNKGDSLQNLQHPDGWLCSWHV